MSSIKPIPKPVDKKKQKKQNGWKNKNQRFCFYHRTFNAERHEVFRGNPNRKISIEHGFQVDLCNSCHEEMTLNITPRAQERNLYWKQYYQELYEGRLKEAGITPKHARQLWMTLIGRNYLEEVE